MTAPRHDDAACARFRESLYEFVSGRLSGDERAASETHAKGCKACAARAEQLKVALSLATPLLSPVPAWLSARTYARLTSRVRHDRAREAERAMPLWRRFVPQLAAAGALAAAAIALTFLFRPAMNDATRFAAVQGAKSVASAAPGVKKAADSGVRIGSKVRLAFGKAMEVTLGY